MKTSPKRVKAGNITFANDLPVNFIAGPCVIESEGMFKLTAKSLKRIFSGLDRKFVLKASFDKANRTSIKSFRGIGIERGLEVLLKVKRELGLPVLVDVHETWQVPLAARVADILQVPAFLSRQTDLILACADSGKTVNIKKGQFLSPWDAANIVEKVESRGNRSILLTERGTSFGYSNLVVDMRSIEIMKDTGYPVIFDCTHSVQRPGGLGSSTGGDIRFSLPLAKSAAALGIAGIFLEAHHNPSRALSDGPNSFNLKRVSKLVSIICKIDSVAKRVAD